MPTATVTSKGQITIPKSVREGLGVDAGDRVEFVESTKGVYTVVAVSRDVRELKGLIAKPARPVTVEAMKRAIAKRASRR
ncbi:MAG: AbrB/MazE/SpoVT family DNA-binding domain-containing protein [Burkholderiales bacterium]|nr:AbrB/MazE/SpoVT family DNA-binding domain-containing protein [Burkholderiales bacterium]